MGESIPKSNILVVESQRNLTDRIESWFGDQYGLFTAHSGREALELHDDDVSITFVEDGLLGEAIEQLLKKNNRGRMVLLSSDVVQPMASKFEVHLDPQTDDRRYHRTLNHLIKQATYERELRQWFDLVSKKAALETKNERLELDHPRDYETLSRRVEDCRERARTTRDEVPGHRFEAVFRPIGHDSY